MKNRTFAYTKKDHASLLGFHWKRERGNGELCKNDVREWFDIPEEAKRIWFTISKKKSKEAYKIKLVPFTDFVCNNYDLLVFDKKQKKVMQSGTEETDKWFPKNSKEGEVFYISLSYED